VVEGKFPRVKAAKTISPAFEDSTRPHSGLNREPKSLKKVIKVPKKYRKEIPYIPKKVSYNRSIKFHKIP
jgi:hypothetical protein